MTRRRYNKFAALDLSIALLRMALLPFQLLEKFAKESAAVELDKVRAEKIREDILTARYRRELIKEQVLTQNEKTIKTSNDAVLTDLKIEEKRRDLGITNNEWIPFDYDHKEK